MNLLCTRYLPYNSRKETLRRQEPSKRLNLGLLSERSLWNQVDALALQDDLDAQLAMEHTFGHDETQDHLFIAMQRNVNQQVRIPFCEHWITQRAGTYDVRNCTACVCVVFSKWQRQGYD